MFDDEFKNIKLNKIKIKWKNSPPNSIQRSISQPNKVEFLTSKPWLIPCKPIFLPRSSIHTDSQILEYKRLLDNYDAANPVYK